jgi:hypothetical protein
MPWVRRSPCPACSRSSRTATPSGSSRWRWAAKAMVIGILAGIAFNAVIFAAVVLAFNL